MILENMNSKEKLGQMSSILSILEDRVDSYIERNRSNLRRRLKTAERTRIQREFSLGTNGKWEVDMFILKVSKDYIQVTFDACQKYFIKYAKDPVSIGAGYYVIRKSFSVSALKYNKHYFEITPHCINRFRERCPEMKDISVAEARDRILDDISNSSNEFDNDTVSEKDENAYDSKFFTELGQYFALLSKEQTYICLTTFVSNELLKAEQLAYSLVVSEYKGRSYSEDDMKKKAIKFIKKTGNDKENNASLEEMKKDMLQRRPNPVSRLLNGEYISNIMKNNIITGNVRKTIASIPFPMFKNK